MNYEEAKRELSITRAHEKALRDAVAYFEAGEGLASEWWWGRTGDDDLGEIIAYRVIK